MQHNKKVALKNLLFSKKLEFLMEAHNGISAKIVEKTGFKGIWASGLTMSASLGVRDNNELSASQVLDMLEYMADSTTLPILVDGDTGHGNFNNVRRFIQGLEKRGIAGVCIEDKEFPKKNSFQEGRQGLASIAEFVGKIKAAKDTHQDPNFVIVARLESFVVGEGNILERAYAYREAGADALVVHSKKNTAEDILSFMKDWNHECPIIVIPTKYYSTPTDLYRKLNISMVIWANHTFRSSIRAMEEVTRRIYHEESLNSIESEVASVKEIFDYQNLKELEEAEAKYFSGLEIDSPIHTALSLN
ncbi:MAG: phosphoenolpyruvate mutase [Chlamydiia bacterium]|nr:phosphoenolpyruvate mutase [Chlamydiia bacterium]